MTLRPNWRERMSVGSLGPKSWISRSWGRGILGLWIEFTNPHSEFQKKSSESPYFKFRKFWTVNLNQRGIFHQIILVFMVFIKFWSRMIITIIILIIKLIVKLTLDQRHTCVNLKLGSQAYDHKIHNSSYSLIHKILNVILKLNMQLNKKKLFHQLGATI